MSDRACELKDKCHCVTRAVSGNGYHFDSAKQGKCEHFKDACPTCGDTKRSVLQCATQCNNGPRRSGKTTKEITENCALGYNCDCIDVAKPWACQNWGRSSLPSPPIVQSKQDRVRMTKQAWDKKRDNMMREAERRFEKLKPQSEIEEKAREIRHNPIKHLEKKGVKVGRRARTR